MWDCVNYDNGSLTARTSAVVVCTGNSTMRSSSPIASNAGWKFESALSPTADILLGCYLIVAELLAVIFNGCVIGVSIIKRKSLKVSDSYVVCLAASDLGHPIVAYPMIVTSSFRHAWVFGDIGCQWNGFTGFFFGVNSMMTLTMMSFSRLLVITNSNFARHHDRSIAVCLIAASISFALFWSMCPMVGWGEYGPEPYRTSCTLIWDHPNKSFVTASFLGCLALPAGIMFFSYFRILSIAIATRHKRLHWAPKSNESRVWEKKEMRLLKMTLLMCTSFMLCWTPYAVVAMVKAYAGPLHLHPSVSAFPALAAKTSHVIDPIIYCGMNKNFNRYIPGLCHKTRELDREQTTQSVPLKNVLIQESTDVL